MIFKKKNKKIDKPKKRSLLNTMDKILIIVGSFLLAYITTMTVIYCVNGSYPETMTHDIIYGCLGEGGIMGIIKVFNTIFKKKDQEQNKDESLDNSDYADTIIDDTEDISEDDYMIDTSC